MAKIKSSAELAQDARDELEIRLEIEKVNKRINNDFTGYLNEKRDLLDKEQEINSIGEALLDLQGDLTDEGQKYYLMKKREYDLGMKIISAQRQQLKNASILTMSMKEFQKVSVAAFSGFLPNILNFLADADKAFKNVNLSLGLSGEQAKIMTSNLMEASSYAMSMGVSFEDLGKIQTSYTDEMGNAVILSKENLKNVIAIGKGTKMGTDVAGKMVGKFDLIGKSVTQVKSFYEDAVNSSAKFGVSAEKVIDKINENLDRSQQYVFKGGVDGLKKMAMYSTKFKVDMTSVFNAMDKANSLEGAVDMAAQLQVIGGKFAQTDPFRLLYQARNDAEGFTKTMQGLTKGMANYNKTTGEFEIQAGDLNRLRLAADATGMSYEELIKQAKQGAKINAIGGLLGGRMGKEEQDFVEGVAQIQKDGNFKIQIAPGEFKDIRQLSQGQVKALMDSNKTLEERAKDAQAFDEVLRNTINEMKTTLLPIIKGINYIVQSDTAKFLLKTGVILMGITAAMSAFSPLISAIKLIAPSIKGSSIADKILGGKGAGSVIPNVGTEALPDQMKRTGDAAGTSYKNILAFGGAILLVGGGIWLATKGISAMAVAFRGLNGDQIVGVNVALVTLGLTLGGLAALAIPLGAAAPELILFGAGIALIGAGVGIAAAGVGYMAKSFGEMFESIANVTDPKVILGINSLMLSMTALGASSLLFANPLAWIGLKMLGNTIGDISDKIREANFDSLSVASKNFEGIASAIEKINEKKLDKLIAVSESLSGIGSLVTVLNSLQNMFGDSIEVKFKDQDLQLHVDITTNMDSQQIGSKLSRTIPLHIERAKKGSSS
jgi:hypothetical protein